MKTEHEQIDAALAKLNVAKIRKAMLAIDHKWHMPNSSDYRTPTTDEIRNSAAWLVRHVLESCRVIRGQEHGGNLYRGEIGGLMVLIAYNAGANKATSIEIKYTV